MIVISTKKSVRKPADSFVNLSRMDYELVCNILRLLDETGRDDEELSFLMGKRNKCFFDVIDPREKQKLSLPPDSCWHSLRKPAVPVHW